MTPVNPTDVQLRDPLSKETRAERRALLGASAIGIVIVRTGLVPSKISALGIEFNQADQRSLLWAIAAVIVYFLIAFLVYAASDFIAWRIAFRELIKARIVEETHIDEDPVAALNDFTMRQRTRERDKAIAIENQLRNARSPRLACIRDSYVRPQSCL